MEPGETRLHVVQQLELLTIKLYEIGAIKFGDFETKSGLNAPIYFDFRVIICYPDVMELLTNLIVKALHKNGVNYKHVSGLPFTSLQLAFEIAEHEEKSALIWFKDGDYKIHGKYLAYDKCLLVQDIMTTEISSILTAINHFRSEGLVVEDLFTVIACHNGALDHLKANDVNVHGLFLISDILNILMASGKIDVKRVQQVNEFIAKNQVSTKKLPSKYDLKFIAKEMLSAISYHLLRLLFL